MAGDTVRIVAQDGRFLALAAYNPESQISARVWDWREETHIDAGFFRERIATAMQMRDALLDTEAGGGSAPDTRRIGWPPGTDRGPLRRRGGDADFERRLPSLARRDHRRRWMS